MNSLVFQNYHANWDYVSYVHGMVTADCFVFLQLYAWHLTPGDCQLSKVHYSAVAYVLCCGIMFLVNVTLCSFVGALAGIEDSDAVLEAVTQGDTNTARRLLKVAESGT